jgi:hypothetical protein
MSDGFDVDIDALQSFARVLTAQGERMKAVNTALTGASVSADSFGKLPNSGSMYTQYDSHATAEVQNSSEMAEVLAAVGSALAAVAGAYLAVEQEVEQSLRAVAGQGAN